MRLRFTICDLFWLTLLAVGWWLTYRSATVREAEFVARDRPVADNQRSLGDGMAALAAPAIFFDRPYFFQGFLGLAFWGACR